MKHQVLGALRPTVGNTVSLTTRFLGHYPINPTNDREPVPLTTAATHSWLSPSKSGRVIISFRTGSPVQIKRPSQAECVS